jgi:hypothetical protein
MSDETKTPKKQKQNDSNKPKSTVSISKQRMVYKIAMSFGLIVKIGRPRPIFLKTNQVINGSHPAYNQIKEMCDEGDSRIIAIEK